MQNILDTLTAILQERKANPSPDSYTTELLQMGEDEIIKKIGEEAVEIIIAAKGQGDQRVIEETADLIYHILVLLVSRDLSWEDVRVELAQRHES